MKRIAPASLLFFAATALLFCAAASVSPQNKAEREVQALEHKTKGLALATAGDWRGAIREYDEAIGLKPDFALAYYDKGIAHTNLGQIPEAEAAYREAIRIDPEKWEYRYNFSILLLTTGKRNEEIEQLKDAKRLNPSELAIRQNLGVAYCDLNRKEEAVAEFTELLKIDDDWNIARPCLAKSLQGLGKTEEALEVYKEYLRRDPGNANVWGTVAALYEKRGDQVNAEGAMLAEIQIREDESDPELGRRLGVLARMYQDHGKLEKAKSTYARALEILTSQPQFASALHFYQQMYENLLHPPVANGTFKMSPITAPPALPPTPEELYQQKWIAGETAQSAGKISEGIDLLKQSLEIAKTLGVQNGELSIAFRRLSDAYRNSHQPTEQKKVLNNYLQEMENRFGKASIPVAEACEALANFYEFGDDLSSEIRFEERALNIRVAESTDRDLMTIGDMTRLSNLYNRRDKKDERVELLLLRAVKATEETTGKNSYNTASVLEELGRHYFWVQDFAKAEEPERRALKINEAKWGATSSKLSGNLRDLSDLMRKLGKPEEADAFQARMEHLDTTK